MVGNDVVDLTLRAAAAKHRDRRFVERVFAPSEQAWIAGSADPSRALWTLWAAKEAAYKAAVKGDPATVFAHRRFVVDPGGVVRFGDLALSVRWQDGDGWVHATCLPPAADWARAHIRIEALAAGDEDPSRAVRRVALDLLRSLGEGDPEIVRGLRTDGTGRRGPPVAVRDGAPLTGIDLSLSHDGAFVAAVVERA